MRGSVHLPAWAAFAVLAAPAPAHATDDDVARLRAEIEALKTDYASLERGRERQQALQAAAPSGQQQWCEGRRLLAGPASPTVRDRPTPVRRQFSRFAKHSSIPGGSRQPWRWLMKVRDVLRLLHRDGWILVATRGSHRQLKHMAKPGRVTVPGKPGDYLAPGTLNSILKQAGLRRN